MKIYEYFARVSQFWSKPMEQVSRQQTPVPEMATGAHQGFARA